MIMYALGQLVVKFLHLIKDSLIYLIFKQWSVEIWLEWVWNIFSVLVSTHSCQQTEKVGVLQVANWKSGMLVWSRASQGLGEGWKWLKTPFLAPWIVFSLIYTDLVFKQSNWAVSDDALLHTRTKRTIVYWVPFRDRVASCLQTDLTDEISVKVQKILQYLRHVFKQNQRILFLIINTDPT